MIQFQGNGYGKQRWEFKESQELFKSLVFLGLNKNINELRIALSPPFLEFSLIQSCGCDLFVTFLTEPWTKLL